MAMNWLDALGTVMRSKTDQILEKREAEQQKQQQMEMIQQIMFGKPASATPGPSTTQLQNGDNIVWGVTPDGGGSRDNLRRVNGQPGLFPDASPAMKQYLTMNPDLAGDILKQQLTQMPKDERTGLIKEYQFAKANGFQGSFMDFMNAQNAGKGTKITIQNPGDTPRPFLADEKRGVIAEPVFDDQGNLIDYRYRYAPGSPAAGEIESEQSSAEQRAQIQTRQDAEQGEVVLTAIDDAISFMDEAGRTEGMVGGALAALPGATSNSSNQS